MLANGRQIAYYGNRDYQNFPFGFSVIGPLGARFSAGRGVAPPCLLSVQQKRGEAGDDFLARGRRCHRHFPLRGVVAGHDPGRQIRSVESPAHESALHHDSLDAEFRGLGRRGPAWPGAQERGLAREQQPRLSDLAFLDRRQKDHPAPSGQRTRRTRRLRRARQPLFHRHRDVREPGIESRRDRRSHGPSDRHPHARLRHPAA